MLRILIVLVSIGVVFAEPIKKETASVWKISFKDLLSLGLEHNQQIRESRIKVEREDNELWLAESRIIPQLSFSNKFFYNQKEVRGVFDETKKGQLDLSSTLSWYIPYASSTLSVTGGIGIGNKYDEENKVSKYYKVSYTQPLLKGMWAGFLRTDLSKARLDGERYSLERRRTEQVVILELMTAWWRLLLYREEWDLAKKRLERERQLLVVKEELQESGEISGLELEAGGIEVGNAEVEEGIKRQQFHNARIDLIENVGIKATREVEGIEFVLNREALFRDVLAKKILKVKLKNIYINENYDLQILNNEVEKSEYEVIEAKDNLFWDINFKATYGESFYNTLSDVDKDFNLSLNFSGVVYNPEGKHRLSQAKENEEVLRIQQRFLIKKTKNQLKKNKRDLRLVLKRIIFLEEKVKYKKKLFEQELNNLELGRANVITVEQVKSEFERSEQELMVLLVEKINLVLEHYRLIGVTPNYLEVFE